MKKVLITGAKGIMGKVLSEILSSDYELTLADLPDTDVRDYQKLEKLVKGQDTIIHLAWNSKIENYESGKSDPDNLLMTRNVYEAAINAGIPRVIMASSIHADDFRNPERAPLSPNDTPNPLTPYGKSKIEIEKMGEEYAKKGIEVVCIRFGAVGYEEPTDKEGKAVWLSNKDLESLIKTLIEAERIPNQFFVMYGVSNNKTSVHDFSNPLGWKPKDDSSKLKI